MIFLKYTMCLENIMHYTKRWSKLNKIIANEFKKIFYIIKHFIENSDNWTPQFPTYFSAIEI